VRITFRKGRRYDGRARLAESYEAKIDGKRVATLQRHGNSPFGQPDNEEAWFWYGGGVNTAADPQTLEKCKAQVKAHFARSKDHG
jgi:hypothetical protein